MLFRILEQGKKKPLGSEIFICLNCMWHRAEMCKNFEVALISHPDDCLGCVSDHNFVVTFFLLVLSCWGSQTEVLAA